MSSSLVIHQRTAGFLAWSFAIVGVFWVIFERAIRGSLHSGYTSHIVAMPFLVGFLVWSERSKIFCAPKYSFAPAAWLAAIDLLILLTTRFLSSKLGPELVSFVTLVVALILIVAGFLAFYGKNAFKSARFSILVLLLMVPIPSALMDRVISTLQSGSTELTHLLFMALGVPVLREGFVLSIPGVTIEVAKECSGINSTIALFITTLLLAHETLQTAWRRVLLLLISVPLSIVKNAIRITTLTMLAIRVDPSFLTGRLHHEGGFVFFLLTLGIMYPMWRLLYNGEKKQRQTIHQEDKQPTTKAEWSAPTRLKV